MTIESLLVDYIAAGFQPEAFWGLTLRLYDLHMRGAMRRIEREIEISNRQAYNVAALSAGAMAGKLPSFEKVFGAREALRARATVRQAPQVLEANLMAMAIAFGADPSALQRKA